MLAGVGERHAQAHAGSRRARRRGAAKLLWPGAPQEEEARCGGAAILLFTRPRALGGVELRPVQQPLDLTFSPRRPQPLTTSAAMDQTVAKRTLQELIRREDLGNKICADCSNPNPQWASVRCAAGSPCFFVVGGGAEMGWASFAIFICLQCAGHHRGYGVHIR